MPRYKVWTEEAVIKYVEVDANTRDEAENKVHEMYKEMGHSDFAETVDEVNFKVQHIEVKNA